MRLRPRRTRGDYLLGATADGSKKDSVARVMADNAIAVECVAGRSASLLKMVVARCVLNNFVFAHSTEHCHGRSAAVMVCELTFRIETNTDKIRLIRHLRAI